MVEAFRKDTEIRAPGDAVFSALARSRGVASTSKRQPLRLTVEGPHGETLDLISDVFNVVSDLIGTWDLEYSEGTEPIGELYVEEPDPGRVRMGVRLSSPEPQVGEGQIVPLRPILLQSMVGRLEDFARLVEREQHEHLPASDNRLRPKRLGKLVEVSNGTPEAEDPDPPNREAIELLDEWLADESGYDEETWPELKDALDRNRPSGRKLFGG